MSNPIYDARSLSIGSVLDDVRTGRIGLPDLQRPFVWKNDKVRDLLDSMLRGYPIGYIMLWDSPADMDGKSQYIGDNNKVYKVPKSLVIDGQQRLTALLAALYGIEVRDSSYKTRSIRIAFNPLDRSFKNADASTDRDPRYISSVSEVFAAYHDMTLPAFRQAFVDGLNESNAKKGEEPVSTDQQYQIENGLNELLSLERYPIPTLEISAQADEEMVSDIFVRVNSQGQTLKQDDFIMTLLSVYEPHMRESIEKFCADSHVPAKGTSYNPLVEVTPTHVIRTTVGVGFKRGRLRYAYQILRGRDLETKVTSEAKREENFATFGDALSKMLNLNDWHAFITALGQAGYICSEQATSANAIAFCYAFYLIGKYEFGMDALAIRRLASRWFFASSITSFYVGSFETNFERQLNDVKQLSSAGEFEAYFEREIAAQLTDDFFRITMPIALDSNEAMGPAWQGFVASQVILGAKSLFGTVPLSQILTIGASGTKKAVDKHHIFPDNFLKQKGQLAKRSNKANFTLIDYATNIYISDDDPAEYVGRYRAELGQEEYERNCREHALPLDFENMAYEEFLEERRRLMAQLAKTAFERL
ncbi:GmrSD restriction endonuclease domain-containing protein [Collinsella tanakaei]|uniref:GmrSD restriction endonuclease domain-containing protein n=1 Tax=Collinsella tanakaei TaxID=626935 RepID=UPI0019594654|nr:DUF262 domain-containing protein [Collinsella tanakaei]MBM6868163.1 DUF262 domain-containing protein [Collinsella tanakaei]